LSNRSTSTLVSLGIHSAAVALLFTVTFQPNVRRTLGRTLDQGVTLIAPYMPRVAAEKPGGGGGGGGRSVLPASRGALPKAAARQFVPPAAELHNDAPKLIMEPTIVVGPNAPLPVLNMTQLGDPNGNAGPRSDGPGSGGGIGTGKNGGVGPGDGAGYGPGEKWGTGGGPGGPGFGPGSTRGAIIPAALLWKMEPEYSDEARRARLQGTVVLYVEVDGEGKPEHIRVRQSLGLGLDEKAIEAVQHWKFRPGRIGGKAVTTSALVEVNFRLL
jgi:protein TonB